MNDENGEPKRLNKPDQTNAQLIALMQNAWDLIEFAKTQQWRVTYYALLLFAAIAGIKKGGIFGQECWQAIALAIVVLITATFAIWVIFHSHRAQWKARKRIVRCAKHFSDEFSDSWKKPKHFEARWYYVWYPSLLADLTAFAAIFALWVVFFS